MTQLIRTMAIAQYCNYSAVFPFVNQMARVRLVEKLFQKGGWNSIKDGKLRISNHCAINCFEKSPSFGST